MFWCHSWLVMAFALSMDLCDVINVDLNLKVRSLKYRNLRETLLYFMSLSGFFFSLSLFLSLWKNNPNKPSGLSFPRLLTEKTEVKPVFDSPGKVVNSHILLPVCEQ